MSARTEQLPNFFADDQHDYDEIVTPCAERMANSCKMHYMLFWFILGTVTAAAHTLILVEYEGLSMKTVLPSISLGILPSVIVISNIYFSKILEKFTPSLFVILSWNRNDTLEWYTNELRLIFSDKRMIVSGIIMAVVIIPTAFFGPLMPGHIASQISYILVIAIISFTGGGLLYSLFRIIVMIDKLGRTKKVRVSIYQHPLTSIRAIGSLMTRISLISLVIYFIGISYNIVCEDTIITIVTTLFFGIVIMSLFIIPQFKIHTIMSKVKHERLILFSEHLEKALNDVTTNPSDNSIMKVRELFAIQNSLNNMNEWPFDTKMLISILTGIAIPILVVLIQSFFNV